jgi:hypothetical protein
VAVPRRSAADGTKQFPRFSSPGHAVTGDRRWTGAEKRERVGKQFAHSIIDDHTRLATPRYMTTSARRPSPPTSRAR